MGKWEEIGRIWFFSSVFFLPPGGERGERGVGVWAKMAELGLPYIYIYERGNYMHS